MGRIRVSTVMDASPEAVWEELRHIDRHVVWMADAVAIRFATDQREGTGTRFSCDTRVGPIRLVDEMEITRWRTAKAMGVRHVGVVTGTGSFTLRPVRRSRRAQTRVSWDERLVFPWWMLGPVGGVVGGRVMKRIWRRNLQSLKHVVEA